MSEGFRLGSTSEPLVERRERGLRRHVGDMLDEAGVDQLTQPTGAPTRICTTLLEPERTTELIDPSGGVTQAELDGLLELLEGALASVHGVALCGTVPPGAHDLYGRLAHSLAARPEADGVMLLLDGCKGVESVLSSGRCDVLKINVDEARALTGTDGADAAARRLLYDDDAPLRRPGSLVALTDGPRPARLYAKSGRAWRLDVPPIECVHAFHGLARPSRPIAFQDDHPSTHPSQVRQRDRRGRRRHRHLQLPPAARAAGHGRWCERCGSDCGRRRGRRLRVGTRRCVRALHARPTLAGVTSLRPRHHLPNEPFPLPSPP